MSFHSPVTIVKPSKGWVSLKLGELREYRELIYFLTWRDIKVRYKQTVLGVSWEGGMKYCNWLTLRDGLGLVQRRYREGTNRLDWAPVTCPFRWTWRASTCRSSRSPS